MSTPHVTYEARYTSMEEATAQDVNHIIQGLNHYTDPKYLTDFYCNLVANLNSSTEVRRWHIATERMPNM
jgi:hypothetical protein